MGRPIIIFSEISMNTKQLLKWTGQAMTLGVLGFAGWGLSASAPEAGEHVPGQQELPSVSTAEVGLRQIPQTLTLTTQLRAQRTSTIAAQVPGRIVSRKVEVGDKIKAGQVLFELDRRALKHARQAADASVERLHAQHEQAKRDAERAEALKARAVVTTQQAELARSGAQQLEQALRLAQVQRDEASRQLSEAVIRSPFDGMVMAVMAERGEQLGPGQPVLTLVSSSRLEASFEVPERYIDRIKEGMPVQLGFSQREGSESVMAKVSSVGQAAAGGGSLFPVIVTLDDAQRDALPGMTVTARFDLGQERALTVPTSAISSPSGSTRWVYAMDGQRVRRVPVELLGLADRGEVKVRGELEAGQQVITSGQATLVEGQQVRGAQRGER